MLFHPLKTEQSLFLKLREILRRRFSNSRQVHVVLEIRQFYKPHKRMAARPRDEGLVGLFGAVHDSLGELLDCLNDDRRNLSYASGAGVTPQSSTTSCNTPAICASTVCIFSISRSGYKMYGACALSRCPA
jgi:hypothetical protein